MSALSRCLLEEASAIKLASENLDQVQVEKALDLLVSCYENKSKLIITGVGKSGIVARKIAATFSSIGLMSIYLNPLDALHGDLGIVAKDDICILISNSGNTEELIKLIPHLNKRDISCIAIIGNIKSKLGQNCEVVLEANVNKEICPLNLAPTASTAVAMSIGDALAVVWMERCEISQADFAINHPSGSLGKKLTINVENLMIPIKDIPGISPSYSLLDLITSMTQDGIGCAWIEDQEEKGKIIGLVTDGDLRRALEKNIPSNWISLQSRDLMTRDPICINKNELAANAIRIMEKNFKKPISVLPVIDNENNICGLLRLHDLVQAGF